MLLAFGGVKLVGVKVDGMAHWLKVIESRLMLRRKSSIYSPGSSESDHY
ncbi:hypothetical protein HNQ08_001594 [Deinococcus humi]|uniref:Uncharacterized protein n=1 Tax=Deinococcus humi TaxID=662880 RepID=A0A7W8JVN9_9DEIO|nr:hypothetical protein [Deinococcus humi]